MAEPKGFDFPFRVTATEFPRSVTGTDRVEAQIKQVLTTSLFERLNRPTFGSRLQDFVFETINPVTKLLIEAEVARALVDSGVDVSIISIEAVADETNKNPKTNTTLGVRIEFELQGRQAGVTVPLTTGRAEQ